jgi:multiple sugar transport system permease protein
MSRPSADRQEQTSRVGVVAHYALLTVLAAFFLFPLLYMVASSLKADDAVLSGSDSFRAFLPDPWVGGENYGSAVERASFPRALLNSVIISGSIVVLGTVVNSLLGYALARLRFTGRRMIVTMVIALIIIPFEALAVPLLYLSAELGWLDTYQVQILPFVANPAFRLPVLHVLPERAGLAGGGGPG